MIGNGQSNITHISNVAAMPAAQKKAKVGQGIKKSAAKKGLNGLQTISAIMKNLRLQYEAKCKDEKSFPLPAVKNSIREHEERSQLLVKVMFLLFK